MLLELLPDQAALLDQAEQFLGQGKWRKAERACREVLRLQPAPKAAFLLGKICLASGQPRQALDYFHQAAAWDPQFAPAHFSIARLEQSRRELQSAAQSFIRGLQIDPTELTAHLGLSQALLGLGLPEAASIAARQALLVDENCGDAWNQLARAAELAGDLPEATQALRRIQILQPRSIDPLRRLANLYQSHGDIEQGCRLLWEAIELDPQMAGLRFELSLLLVRKGERSEAIGQLREATRLQPHFPEALSNLGLLLRADRQFDEAESTYKRACAQQPSFAPAWNNLANLYVELARLSEAERCYNKALSVAPDYAEAHTGRAMLWLLKGSFSSGWEEYEWRWRQSGQKKREFLSPEWDGSDVAHRTILLHAEQGAGDTIQFIRYSTLLKRRGARVVVSCPASLRPLIQAIDAVDQVIHEREPLPPFDFHAPLMSLPRIFQTELTNLPAEIPYLSVPAGTVVPPVLLEAQGLRVGLVWAGNPNHHNDRNRSIPPELLGPLVAIPGIRFFSLQLGGEPFAAPHATPLVVDLAPYLSSYAETAACLQNLDLLITVDTSVAHLAGALGRPVWMMVPVCNDWRWLLDRSDSPWYPSMRIFRQIRAGEWGDVMTQIERECAALAAGIEN